MAIVLDNIYTKGISGRIGDDLLYKQYGNKTVVTQFPRRSLKPPTSRQLAQHQKFALAVFKTRTWLASMAKRIFLEGLERKWDANSTYYAGITYFMTASTANKGSIAVAQTSLADTAPHIHALQPTCNTETPVPATSKGTKTDKPPNRES